jgi:hypothetical protein
VIVHPFGQAVPRMGEDLDDKVVTLADDARVSR